MGTSFVRRPPQQPFFPPSPGASVNDELERLVTMYDGGQLTRRQLLKGLVAIGVGAGLVTTRHAALAAGAQRDSLFRAHTINHVTIQTADVSRSKAFYQGLTGLPVRAE